MRRSILTIIGLLSVCLFLGSGFVEAVEGIDSSSFEAAMKLYRQQRFAEAIEAFNTILGSEPQNSAAYYFKGYAHYVLGQYAEAKASFEMAFQTDPVFNPRPYFYRS